MQRGDDIKASERRTYKGARVNRFGRAGGLRQQGAAYSGGFLSNHGVSYRRSKRMSRDFWGKRGEATTSRPGDMMAQGEDERESDEVAGSAGVVSGVPRAGTSERDLAGCAPKQRAREGRFPAADLLGKGPELFRHHCAPCHGEGGKGEGPVAGALKAKMTDLTTLAKRNRKKFPAERVRKVIVGDEILASHGSREMPVWGPIFHQVEWD